MAAYLFANVDVRDPILYEEYRKQVPATLARYGGKFIVRGGATEVLEGKLAPRRIIIIEFESLERAKAWWDSPEYRPLRALRQRASEGDLLLVAGV
jgi:uncharacterized protein (DUF1330 family)